MQSARVLGKSGQESGKGLLDLLPNNCSRRQGSESPASWKHVNESREDVEWFVERPWLLSFNGFAQFQDSCTGLIIQCHTSVGVVSTTPQKHAPLCEGLSFLVVGKAWINEVNRSHRLWIAALKGWNKWLCGVPLITIMLAFALYARRHALVEVTRLRISRCIHR